MCVSLCGSEQGCPQDLEDGWQSPCFYFGPGYADLGECLDGCNSDADCRSGYLCYLDPDSGLSVCE
jgi:hypothetical protein